MGILGTALVVTIILKICGVIATWKAALMPFWIWLGLVVFVSVKEALDDVFDY